MFFVGMDGAAALKCADTVELNTLLVIKNKLLELREKERQDLATKIINTLGKAMKS